ncbi:hypothetical protein [Streptomyces sp. NPDC057877]|uniref:hypothetical protein n=1 Tax=Streptomyces sp. NPDC057877 TaxID=3346269 RepID=UPI0036A2CFA0
MTTELEKLQAALVRAIKGSAEVKERAASLLEQRGLSRSALALRDAEWVLLPAPVLDDLRRLPPEAFADLQAIAAGQTPDTAPDTATPHPAADHLDFRESTFHDQVVGVQHNHYNTAPTTPDWRPVEHVGPLEFGVRPTRHVPGLPDVPPYVPRDRDADLSAKVAHPGLVLILGEPYTGKSYTAWQAVQGLTGHRLYAPYPGEDLRGPLGAMTGGGGKYVVWLDEVTDHLGEGGLDPRLLGRFTSLGALVLGTMSPEEYYRRRSRTAPGDRAVATARTVEVPREWSEAELARLARLGRADPRAYPAYMWSGREGAASYFAVGHLLFDEWRRPGTRQDHPRGQLLVRAAVDLARCGVTGAVPVDLLRRVQEQYGAEDRESFEDALAWATAPMFGVSGLLVQDDEDGTCRAYGALVAEALRPGDLEPVPDDVWWTLLDAAREEGSPLDADAVLEAARSALQPRIEAGDLEVTYGLGTRTEGMESLTLLSRAASAGHPLAAWEMGRIALGHGEVESAVPLFKTAAEHGVPGAATALGKIMLDQAGRWLRQGVEEGDPEAAHLRGDLLLGGGDLDGALICYSRAEQQGYTEVARSMGAWLLLHGAGAAAGVWLERAADAGDHGARELLNIARDESRSLADADKYVQDAEGYPLESAHVGVLLEKRGRPEEAREKYEKAYKNGDAYGAYRLALLLSKQKKPHEAMSWYHKAARMGHPAAQQALDETPDGPDTVEE